MPEYLAAGVYIEETSVGPRAIEGVSTTTAAFVGPARGGAVGGTPEIVTSLVEFERRYGGGARLRFAPRQVMQNYVWHAVRAFFEEGGTRLYVSRVFKAAPGHDGHARAWLPASSGAPGDESARLSIRAAFPGAAGNVRVRLTVHRGDAVTLDVTVLQSNGSAETWHGLSLDLEPTPGLPIAITRGSALADAAAVLDALVRAKPALGRALDSETSTDAARSIQVTLKGGTDGIRPGVEEYEKGLEALAKMTDISMMATPGATFGYKGAYRADAVAITNRLLAHTTGMRDRIALVDAGPVDRRRSRTACDARFIVRGAVLPVGARARPGHPT